MAMDKIVWKPCRWNLQIPDTSKKLFQCNYDCTRKPHKRTKDCSDVSRMNSFKCCRSHVQHSYGRHFLTDKFMRQSIPQTRRRRRLEWAFLNSWFTYDYHFTCQRKYGTLLLKLYSRSIFWVSIFLVRVGEYQHT